MTYLNQGVIMPSTINLSLTDELRAYIDQNCGDGTTYATPSEFLRSLIRENKERKEAESLRADIIEGYQDVLHGRVIGFNGSLSESMAELADREHKGWA
jgi:antitoxin ParD1/3/4